MAYQRAAPATIEITAISDEASAIAAVKRRDPSGLDWLMCAHQDKAVRTAYLVLGDRQTAEDAVADAFVTAYQKIAQFDARRPFWPWLCRIVMNNALQWLRKNKALEAWDDALPLASPDASPHERAELSERQRRIFAAVNRLTPEQRVVVVMRYYHDLDDRAIAEALVLPGATVRWRMHRARKKLRDALGKDPVLSGAWEDDT
jgi:RNA polymerase sigma-70 factor, ECF subfamily